MTKRPPFEPPVDSSLSSPTHDDSEESKRAAERDDVRWEDTTTESHPGVSFESWQRARGWMTED